MSSQEPAQDHTLTQKRKQSRKRNKWIMLGVIAGVVGIAIVFAFINSMKASQKALQQANQTQTTSDISSRAATVTAAKSKSNRLTDSAPALLDAEVTQSKEKQKAKDMGVSHVDSTDVLSGQQKKQVVSTAASTVAPEVEAEVDEVDVDATKKANPQQGAPRKPTKEEVLVNNFAKLMKQKPYYPPEFDTQSITDGFFKKHNGLDKTKNFISDISAKSTQYFQEASVTIPNDRQMSPNSERIESNTVSSSTNEDEKTNGIRILDMGEMTTGEIRRAINSDYKVDVYIHLAEVPLQKAVLKAKFEFTEQEDGLVLKVTMLQLGDYVKAVNGYVINIGTNGEPLFDQDVDTHFFRRFAARASAAFVAPWIDWSVGSTTTVVNGSVVSEVPTVTDTVDRVLGGIGNVAKEFLPELQKNANIKPTIRVPANTPVGVVFSEPLYLPRGMFTNDKRFEDRKYDHFIQQNNYGN
ncbi:hypothetical protein KW459_16010 [Vibrio fluvialis]|nr:hypothetical protein [Vibrio fluvialis]